MRQPPYSPDMAPCDFFYSINLRNLKGKRFVDVENNEHNAREKLLVITKTVFDRCF
jgi:hypothetical protein